MTALPELIVIGGGGHCRVVIDIFRRGGEVPSAIVDADASLHGSNIDGVSIIGGDDIVLARSPDEVILVNAVGNVPRQGISGLGVRRQVFERFKARDYRFATVISDAAVVSAAAILGEGCHVITGAIIHAGAKVDENAIINTGAQLDHDCQVGAHSHVAPGAVLCGKVGVGVGCHVGAGAVVIQGLQIGAGAVVAAGAVVVADVLPGTTVRGVPARS